MGGGKEINREKVYLDVRKLKKNVREKEKKERGGRVDKKNFEL